MYTRYETGVLRQEDGAVIPLDAENADYQVYLEWLAQGNTPDEPAGPSHADLVLMAKASTRIERQPIIDVLDGLQASALALADQPRALVIETAKQGLRDLTDIDLSACVTFEDMRLLVKNRYLQLAGALPADVRKAFSEAIN